MSVPVTGSTSYAGYYTIPLAETVSLAEGDVFSVVITLEKESGGEINFFVDKTYQNGNWVSFINQVKAGESFRLLDGKWEDMAVNGITARIKAFTNADESVSAGETNLTQEEGKNNPSKDSKKDSTVSVTTQTAVDANGESVTQTSPSSPTKSANTYDSSGQRAAFWIMVMLAGIFLIRRGKSSSIVEK